jgi:hypothetical protein
MKRWALKNAEDTRVQILSAMATEDPIFGKKRILK